MQRKQSSSCPQAPVHASNAKVKADHAGYDAAPWLDHRGVEQARLNMEDSREQVLQCITHIQFPSAEMIELIMHQAAFVAMPQMSMLIC